MISIPLDQEIFAPVLCPWICFSVSWFIALGNLNRICIQQLCENCINLNYIELVHIILYEPIISFYYIILHFCLSILLIFESFILKLQVKVLIYLLKSLIVIYSETTCNFVVYFPSLLKCAVFS